MSKQTKPVKKQPASKPAVKKTVGKSVLKKTPEMDDAMVDSFIMEVDEEVKNDSLKAFFQKYGLYIVAFVVLILSATVSFDTIKNWRENQFKARTDEYIAANYAPTNAEKIKVLEKIVAGNHGIYSELARIQIADLLFEENKTEDALNLLEFIITNDELNPRIRNLAAFKVAAAKIDTASYEQIESLLMPIISANDSWSPIAQEYLALAAIKNGKIEKAKAIYTNLLQDTRLSDEFRNRIQDMLSTIADI